MGIAGGPQRVKRELFRLFLPSAEQDDEPRAAGPMTLIPEG